MDDYPYNIKKVVLPKTVTHLIISNVDDTINYINEFHEGLAHLTIEFAPYIKYVGFKLNKLNKLPSTLKTLKLSHYNYSLEKNLLPIHLETLELNFYDKIIDDDVLPISLRVLKLNSITHANKIKQFSQLTNLTKLKIPDLAMRSYYDCIPKSLKLLRLLECNRRPGGILYEYPSMQIIKAWKQC
jgi:hypothetical protein